MSVPAMNTTRKGFLALIVGLIAAPFIKKRPTPARSGDMTFSTKYIYDNECYATITTWNPDGSVSLRRVPMRVIYKDSLDAMADVLRQAKDKTAIEAFACTL